MARIKDNLIEEFIKAPKLGLKPILALIISSVAVMMSLYHLYTAFFGEPIALAHRSLFLTFVLILAFMLKPLIRKSWQDTITWPFYFDLFLVCLTLFVQIYLLWDINAFELRFGDPSGFDTMAGTIALLLVLEASRRTVGLPMVLITLFFLIHTIFGNYFPGILHSPPTDWAFYINTILN